MDIKKMIIEHFIKHAYFLSDYIYSQKYNLIGDKVCVVTLDNVIEREDERGKYKAWNVQLVSELSGEIVTFYCESNDDGIDIYEQI